jgi:hypothetical protein
LGIEAHLVDHARVIGQQRQEFFKHFSFLLV